MAVLTTFCRFNSHAAKNQKTSRGKSKEKPYGITCSWDDKNPGKTSKLNPKKKGNRTTLDFLILISSIPNRKNAAPSAFKWINTASKARLKSPKSTNHKVEESSATDARSRGEKSRWIDRLSHPQARVRLVSHRHYPCEVCRGMVIMIRGREFLPDCKGRDGGSAKGRCHSNSLLVIAGTLRFIS